MSLPHMPLSEFSEINPRVRIPTGHTVPFIAMDDLSVDRRDAYPSLNKPFAGGSKFQDGDTLFARITPCLENGKTARARLNNKIGAGSTEFVVLRGRSGISDSGFIYYLMRNPEVREQAISRMEGTSGRQRVSSSFFNDCLVPKFSLGEQRAIVEVLGALDDKIAANTKLAETTEMLARSIYTTMLHDVDKLPLSTTAEFVNGKAFTKGASGTGRVVIRIAELNSGIGGSTVYSDVEADDKHIARAGDLLFAWSGSLTLHRWHRDEGIVNQHIFKVIPKEGYPLWLVSQLLQSKLKYFKAVAADKATTMGHIQRRHLDEPVLIPSPDALQARSVLMEGLWNRGLLAEEENEKLAATRDALLPQLMSGKLRVRDIENTMGEMV